MLLLLLLIRLFAGALTTMVIRSWERESVCYSVRVLVRVGVEVCVGVCE